VIFADALSAVTQFIPPTDPRAEAIACWMVLHNVSVIHAAWELYGRAKGLPCGCAPCRDAEAGEVVMRILVQGRAFAEEARA